MKNENHCIGTFWTEREIAVIDALSKKQELSHIATLRQALRNYQLIVDGVPALPDKADADFIGIPNVPTIVHHAERFNNAANIHAEDILPKVLELADSECGGSDTELIYELSRALRHFAESEIAWRNAHTPGVRAALGHMLKLVEDGVLVQYISGDMTKFTEQSARLKKVLKQAQEALA